MQSALLGSIEPEAVKYWMSRGDFGVIIVALGCACYLLWRWGSRMKYTNEELAEIVKQNTKAQESVSNALSEFVKALKAERESREELQHHLLQMFQQTLETLPKR